jgi:hypothetical protein
MVATRLLRIDGIYRGTGSMKPRAWAVEAGAKASNVASLKPT